MTALSLERIVHPVPSAVAPRIRAYVTARMTMVQRSVRAARELESAASPTAQVRVAERFASSITS